MRSWKAGRPESRGFSLVEVIVALVVLEVGLVGVAGLAVRSFRLLSASSLRSRAVLAAEEVVDSLAVAGVREDGERPFEAGNVRWVLTGEGGGGGGTERLEGISVVATGPSDEVILTVHGILPAR